MSKRVAIVTKDKGGFNVAKPVADALKAAGHTVLVYAEGVAGGEWVQAGVEPVFRGPLNFQETPFDFNEWRLLREANPDAVVATMGAPINMENAMACKANGLGIPLVIIEDVWASFTRTQAEPQLVFTLDEFGRRLLTKDARTKDAKILISGNPAVQNLQVPEDLREFMDDLRFKYGRLVLFCGEGEGTADLLRVALGSLRMSMEDFVLIPRFHPKYADKPALRIAWDAMLDLFEGRGSCRRKSVLRLDDVRNTDALAALCDITMSGVSTTLIHAAKNGRLPVAITTPYCQALYQPSVDRRYQRFPGIDLGYAIELTEPVDNLFERCAEQRPQCREAAKKAFVAQMSPAEMAEAIIAVAR